MPPTVAVEVVASRGAAPRAAAGSLAVPAIGRRLFRAQARVDSNLDSQSSPLGISPMVLRRKPTVAEVCLNQALFWA
jgi:hypothetical protein